MAKQAYVYSGTEWVPLASEVTNLSAYQTKASNQFAHRNIIINGDMQIAQRGTSVSSVTSGGYLTADRWNEGITTQGTWTISVENDAPTGSGFRKSLKWLCTTADASPAAGDNLQFFTTLEGQNLQHIKKGTASAEQLTLSFWVKSNVTGTYIAELYDADNTRQTSKSYTISSSGVWEYKTITFAADTTGAFDNDNALSLYVIFGLGAGTNFTSGTLQTSWASASNANRFVGQTNLASAINNYWQITGVQLEVGATATPFEFKSVEDELLECQRYYWRIQGNASSMYPSILTAAVSQTTTNVIGSVQNPVPMRDVPGSLEWSTLAYQRWDGTMFAVSNIGVDQATDTPFGFMANWTVATTTASTAGRILGNNSASSYFAVNAEL